MKGFLVALFLTLGIGLSAQNVEVKVIKMSALESLMNPSDNKGITVINFWASWCGPCIAELPYFDEAANRSGVEVHLVSLDFIEDIGKAQNIADKKVSSAPVYLLDESKYIEKIDASWSGALPATLIIDRKGVKHFFERSFTESELKSTIDKLNN